MGSLLRAIFQSQVQRILEAIGKEIPQSNYDLMGALVTGVQQEYLRSQSMATLSYLLKDESEVIIRASETVGKSQSCMVRRRCGCRPWDSWPRRPRASSRGKTRTKA